MNRFVPLVMAICCLILAGCGSFSQGAANATLSRTRTASWRCTSSFSPCNKYYRAFIPKPLRVSPSLKRQARTVFDGYSRALVHHDLSRARSYLSAHSIWRSCDQVLGHKLRYLRCLLDDTPLPLHYEIGSIDHEVAGSKEITTVVSYYLHPPGHPAVWRYQPFYLTVKPSPQGFRIVGGGLPRG